MKILIYCKQHYFKQSTMKLPHTLVFLAGVCMWYISSIMINVHWKSTFKSYGLTKSTTNQHYQYAMFFTTVQFAAGAVTSLIIMLCLGKFENITSLCSWWRKGVVIGILFYFGQLSTNMSLTMTSVALTHMVKTLEPLLALLWGLTILKNEISCASIIHMQIMMVGVLLAGYTEVTFNLTGVIFAIVSNVSLSLRNLFIKLSNNNEMVNGLQLFFGSCLFGFLYSSCVYLFTKDIFMNTDYNCFSVESLKMGIYFSGQHIMSYLLLYYVSITSHALMNCLKRALIIFVSAILLQVTLPTVQIFGIIITIIGSILYAIEIKKNLNGNLEKISGSNVSGKFAQIIGYKFSKFFKIMLFLPLALLLCLKLTGNNEYIRYLLLRLRHEHATAVWAFDAPIDLKSIELINNKLDSSFNNLKIFCSNVDKCQKSVNEFNSTSFSIQIIQLQAFDISKDTPVAAWMAAHPINKIKSLTCFPAYFHKMMYLSTLWKYGGIVIDMALNVTDNSVIKDFMILSSFEGCLLDKSKSNVLICNLLSRHRYTELLMGEVSKLFLKNPKSCTFDSSLQYLNNLTNTISSSVGYIIPKSEIKFGLLGYDDTHNLGDEMQSIAAAHILPHIHTFINRQTFTNPNKTSLTYIGNAWWDINGILFKDIPKLTTVPVAVHIKPNAYKIIKTSKSLLTAMAPIGARDLKTYEILIENGIASFFTGCITLWMKNPDLFTNLKRNNQIIIVDPNWKHNPIPKTLTNIKYMTHGTSEIKNHSMEGKYLTIYEYLIQYSRARLVITSRIHVALPCVAIGTPVIFMNSKQIFDAGKNPTSRVAGLMDMFHTVDMYKLNTSSVLEYFKTFNWKNPPPNPNPEKVNLLKREARRILERIPELAVSLKVLELI